MFHAVTFNDTLPFYFFLKLFFLSFKKLQSLKCVYIYINKLTDLSINCVCEQNTLCSCFSRGCLVCVREREETGHVPGVFCPSSLRPYLSASHFQSEGYDSLTKTPGRTLEKMGREFLFFITQRLIFPLPMHCLFGIWG